MWIIDHSVIKFLHVNQQIFDKGINLDVQVPYPYNAKKVQPNWDDFARQIWPIFAPKIRHLSFFDSHNLDYLRLHASPSFLSNLDIISIRSNDLLPAEIADDGPYATIGEALTKWLHTPRSDGKPKQLSCRDYEHTSETKRMIKSCPAHVLHNAARRSADNLPIDIEVIVFKIAGHFRHSTQRVERFKELCDYFDATFTVLNSHGPTRWTNLSNVVQKIYVLWQPLCEYFKEDGPFISFYKTTSDYVSKWFCSERYPNHIEWLTLSNRQLVHENIIELASTYFS
ncbi:hypothetical protein niasHT_018367 [Heterodera trifolii]|uniref:Uncharacterized protein n=1 Tax=Heterodera trifolii TaxID=157864 RepID=A0ABD2LDA6_9BILA